jgi:hypothetical protein
MNIVKAIILATVSETLYDSIFFCRPTNRYAATMLTIKGVNIAAKKLKISKVNAIINAKITVSSLLNIRLKKLFRCFIIFMKIAITLYCLK